jgi:ABC-type multidrug transport system fused ATPase/permease subunit
MKIGIYVHIPFCIKKCYYCDFVSYANSFEMQDDYIYDNTIKHNIELYKTYSENEINEATEKAELLETIEKLDKKYNTLIGDNGVKLSGGQKQRLILSRNLVTNPEIIIIDNGFTGLDIETRKRVVENLNNRNNKTTLVIITSMIEDIKNADKIYKLEDKTLVEMDEREEVYNA